MRLLLVLLLSVGLQAPVLSRDVRAQQPAPQKPPEQTFSPQTYSPQTYSPQTYSAPSYKPQSNSEQSSTQPRPPRRLVIKCIIDGDPDDYCSFYSYQAIRSGSPCSCDGTRGKVD